MKPDGSWKPRPGIAEHVLCGSNRCSTPFQLVVSTQCLLSLKALVLGVREGFKAV
jgi:hypothetical protein